MNAATGDRPRDESRWLPSISSMVAFIRVAMNRSASGEMALSRVAIWYHVRRVLQPSADSGSPIAATELLGRHGVQIQMPSACTEIL